MARFCEYCGRQIDEGECDCPGAVAAREREALAQKAKAVSEGAQADDAQDAIGNTAAEVHTGAADCTGAEAAQDACSREEAQNVSDTSADSAPAAGTPAEVSSSDAAQSPKGRVEEVLGSAGAEVAVDLKSLFEGMFTSPIETLKENAGRKDHTSSYIIAAVLSVLTFIVIAIMGDTPLVNQTIGRGTLVIFSLSAAVAIFLFKAVYAACITFWGKKYNPELTYSSALATFCLLGIYDLVMLIVFTFFTALSIYELSIVLLFFWLVVITVSGIVATWVLTDGRADSVIRVNLIIIFVLMILIVLSVRGMIIEMFAGALNVIMNTLAGM